MGEWGPAGGLCNTDCVSHVFFTPSRTVIYRARVLASLAHSPTAPVQLVYALHASLTAITTQAPSLAERFAQHRQASGYIKDSLSRLGFTFVPLDRSIAANGMSAVKYPTGVTAADILPKLAE